MGPPISTLCCKFVPTNAVLTLTVALDRRHNDSVVVRDRDSQQLALRNVGENNGDLELPDCPYCHRPLRDPSNARSSRHGTQPEFINPNYFRMLHDNLPSSAGSSHPPSPRRGLWQPQLPQSPTSDPNRSRTAPTSQGISSAAFAPNYFQKFFVEERVLGKGGKGVAFLVNHVLDGVSLGRYACKRVPVGDDHQWLERVLGEVQLLQHLSHQNLVSYRHVWLEDAQISTFGPSVPCAFILQQYCNAGDLHSYIYGSVQTSDTPHQLKERLRRKSKGQPEPPMGLAGPRKLQFDEIYSFFKDITSGLRHLHVNGYIHRDLKPSNCLLHETGDGVRVLVSDFGEVQSQDAMRKSTGATGTVSYCAPEVLRHEYPGGPFGNFTFKSDIFSLGMILYFLCFAQLPYSNAEVLNEEKEDLDQLREEISQWAGFNDVRRMRPELPEKLYFFLERLLSVDPNRRPSADDVLNGIQAGGSANDLRFKKANSAGSDMLSGSRIRAVDSPSDPPMPRQPRSPTQPFSRSPTLRRGSVFDSNYTRASSTAVEDEPERNQSLSPERDLMVRPRFSNTPTPSAGRSESREDHPFQEELPTPKAQLLPPPPSLHSTSFTQRYLPTSVLQFVMFFVKIVSASHPCAPLATNPWILYPLMFLAASTLRVQSVKFQVLFLVIHLILVGAFVQLGVFCVRDSAR